MAEAAIVAGLLGKLADISTGLAAGALLNKLQKRQDVSRQIEQWQHILRYIQAMLRNADSKRNTNELVAVWLNDFREIAHRIATVIDTFPVKIEENSPKSSNWVKKIKKEVKTYKRDKGTSKELEKIRGDYERIWQLGNQFIGIQVNLAAVDDPEPSDNVHDPVEVGFENDKSKIIIDQHKELEDTTGDLKRICQHGIDGGIPVKVGAQDDVDDPEPSDNVPDPEEVGFENDKGKIIIDLHKELEDITGDLKRIYQGGIDGGIQAKVGALDDVDDPEPSDNVPDPEVVGFENDKVEIIKQLLDRSISRRTVLSIVGIGGLGKTTLAKKVYQSAELEGQFDCRAWLTISQKYNLNDLLREILYSVQPQMKNKNPPITDGDLVLNLKSSFRGKRYLIILDDVWDMNLWEQFERALPVDPDNASRVIITSRSLDVAKAADRNTQMYKLDYLNDDDSLALLFRKALQQHIQPKNYPRDLLEIAKRLTKKCGGLPLALVVLGGILKRRDDIYSAWSKVEDTLDWHDEDGEKCMKILARSYEDLPDHLKSCFLYFAAFPEDYQISARQVIGMWMTEEFIQKARGGTIEDRAEKCLEELVQRCLIQVTKKLWNGYCKYCNMHDLLRDLAITKASEENFLTVFSKQDEDVNQLAEKNPHRAALQFCTLKQDGVCSENTLSLLCFGNFGEPMFYDKCGFSKLNYSGFRLLRMLTLERVDMIEYTQPQWLQGLADLRYLGLRGCRYPLDIFEKFSNNLETIDLKGSVIAYAYGGKRRGDLCDVVIPTLRHVYGVSSLDNLPFKWDQHANLQTIKEVKIPVELVPELGCCVNLRTLGFRIVMDHIYEEKARKEWENLKRVLRMNEQLVYLSISIGHQLLPFGGTTGLPCHEKIQRLYLEGAWVRDIFGVPSVEMFPTNLTKLTLINSGLEEDPMPILERLQSLRILYLGFESYEGTKLICLTGGFLKLQKLKLIVLENLCHWDIEEGAMPTLTHLQIEKCKKLHTLPELQKVPTLQELFIIPSTELLESMQGDKDKIEHIPSVTIKRDTYFESDEW